MELGDCVCGCSVHSTYVHRMLVSQYIRAGRQRALLHGKPVEDRGIDTLFADILKHSTQSFLCYQSYLRRVCTCIGGEWDKY